ncbi:hypothetical protein B0T11DRAFT_281334 [Plectosphaerella cucumerina]|uniref:Secreted protein n=1 Tax=Plectosphaerella cucumerina TaxID=40658 RepID=A0A8K0TFN6_9PEZI|nr:hypothetical protein B0T11DRAFT_281334 [Plectosphaerella cucumerina]
MVRYFLHKASLFLGSVQLFPLCSGAVEGKRGSPLGTSIADVGQPRHVEGRRETTRIDSRCLSNRSVLWLACCPAKGVVVCG